MMGKSTKGLDWLISLFLGRSMPQPAEPEIERRPSSFEELRDRLNRDGISEYDGLPPGWPDAPAIVSMDVAAAGGDRTGVYLRISRPVVRSLGLHLMTDGGCVVTDRPTRPGDRRSCALYAGSIEECTAYAERTLNRDPRYSLREAS